MFQTSREQETIGTSTKHTVDADDGSHLDSIGVNEIDTSGAGSDAVFTIDQDGNQVGADLDDEPPAQMDREAFYIVFSSAFNLPPAFVPDLAPLAIKPEEEAPARAASDGVYALLEIYYPAALMPQGETFAHLMAVIPFAMVKISAMRAVIAARKAPPPPPEPTVNKDKKTDTQAPPPAASGDLVEIADWERPQ